MAESADCMAESASVRTHQINGRLGLLHGLANNDMLPVLSGVTHGNYRDFGNCFR